MRDSTDGDCLEFSSRGMETSVVRRRRPPTAGRDGRRRPPTAGRDGRRRPSSSPAQCESWAATPRRGGLLINRGSFGLLPLEVPPTLLETLGFVATPRQPTETLGGTPNPPKCCDVFAERSLTFQRVWGGSPTPLKLQRNRHTPATNGSMELYWKERYKPEGTV